MITKFKKLKQKINYVLISLMIMDAELLKIYDNLLQIAS